MTLALTLYLVASCAFSLGVLFGAWWATAVRGYTFELPAGFQSGDEIVFDIPCDRYEWRDRQGNLVGTMRRHGRWQSTSA